MWGGYLECINPVFVSSVAVISEKLGKHSLLPLWSLHFLLLLDVCLYAFYFIPIPSTLCMHDSLAVKVSPSLHLDINGYLLSFSAANGYLSLKRDMNANQHQHAACRNSLMQWSIAFRNMHATSSVYLRNHFTGWFTLFIYLVSYSYHNKHNSPPPLCAIS